MMTDYDEDVVFENSVLHHHLKNVGFNEEDVQAETKTLQSNVQETCITDGTEQGMRSSVKLPLWSRLKSYIVDYVFDDSWKAEITKLCRTNAHQVSEECLKCGTGLVEEDAAYVDSFSSSLRWNSLDDEPRSEESILGQMLTQIAVLGVTMAYGFFRMFYVKSSDSSSSLLIYALDFLSVVMTTVALAPASLKFAFAGRLVSRLEGRSTAVTKLLEEVDRLQRLVRKTTLFVRETELIHRGFTLVTASTLRLESNSEMRQCRDLRRGVFFCSRRVFSSLRESTKSLVKQLEVVEPGMDSSDLLCSMPTSSFGLCITLGEEEKELLSKETDRYCLTAIKDMNELLNVQLSEFIRTLCILCLLQAEQSRRFSVYHYPDHVSVLNQVAELVRANISSLDHSFVLHKNLVNKMADIESRKATRNVSSHGDGMSRMTYVAVHSLLLHLQAACVRLQEFDSKLETTTDNGNDSLSPDLTAELSSALETVGREINASKDCCDEAVCRLGKLLNLKSTPASTEKPMESEEISVTGCSIKPMEIIPQSNPLVEDQVFEVTTTSDASDCYDSNDMMSDERASKQDKREVLRVLSELRSVIAVRAKDTAERERIALLRQNLDQGSSVVQPSHDPSSPGSLTAPSYLRSEQNLSGLASQDSSATAADFDQMSKLPATGTVEHLHSRPLRTGSDHSSVHSASDVNCHAAGAMRVNETDDSRLGLVDDLSVVTDVTLFSDVKNENLSQTSYKRSDADDGAHAVMHLNRLSESNGDESPDKSDSDSEEPWHRSIKSKYHTEALPESRSYAPSGTFTSVVARLAVEKSRQMPALSGETFGDDDSDDDSIPSEDEE